MNAPLSPSSAHRSERAAAAQGDPPRGAKVTIAKAPAGPRVLRSESYLNLQTRHAHRLVVGREAEEVARFISPPPTTVDGFERRPRSGDGHLQAERQQRNATQQRPTSAAASTTTNECVTSSVPTSRRRTSAASS